jgi:hypothetical protein
MPDPLRDPVPAARECHGTLPALMPAQVTAFCPEFCHPAAKPGSPSRMTGPRVQGRGEIVTILSERLHNLRQGKLRLRKRILHGL